MAVAAKTAFAIAGAIGGTADSPTPRGCAIEERICTSTCGISESDQQSQNTALLAGAWRTVIAASLIYWETCRLANGAAAINLRDSGLWMVEIWSGSS